LFYEESFILVEKLAFASGNVARRQNVMRQLMIDSAKHKNELLENGFTTIDHIYSKEEVEQILATIDQVDKTKETFRKSSDLFAIRRFLNEVPETRKYIFNDNLQNVIRHIFGDDYFAVKSIYFDKPEASNWYVSYHQDLTISVDKKLDLEGYGPWTVKQNQFAVQPPLDILKNLFTIRIHLDDTDENNGALKVISSSHLKNIYRPETIDWTSETETICKVKKGGIMIMKPLLLHSSSRTINNKKRRVIHIEFTCQELPTELNWAERLH
jgi:ectoine hydroxylase-related dioxygenase (phytanoyl-CoA dioxygenase family)